ncbi:unnamed protein product, partial [Protopolystoma xenopodis]
MDSGGDSDGAGDSDTGGINSSGAAEEGPNGLVGCRGLRASAANRSYVGMDVEGEGDSDAFDGENGTGGLGSGDDVSGSGNRRRRKPNDDDEPFEIRLKEPAEARFPHLMRKTSEATRRRRERVGFGVSRGPNGPSSTKPYRQTDGMAANEAAEAGSLKRFVHRLDCLLENEDLDLKFPVTSDGALK